MLSFFPRSVLDEILNLIESVSEDFPSYSYIPPFFHGISAFLDLEFPSGKTCVCNSTCTERNNSCF